MKVENIVFFSVLFYIFLWLISPVEVQYFPSLPATLLFFLMFFSIQSGIVFFKINDADNLQKKMYINYCKLSVEFLSIIVVICIIGLLLRFTDKVIIRNFFLYTSAVERRDSLTESSFFGILSAPLYAFCLTLPVFLIRIRKSLMLKVLLIVLYFTPSLEVLYNGSRGLFITTFAMLYIYIYYIWGINKKTFFSMLLIAILFFIISSYIFTQRILSYGYLPLSSMLNSGYAFTLIPNNFAINIISEEANLFGYTVSMLVNVSQYYLHGFLEWSYLFDHYSHYGHLYGIYTFSIFAKLFGIKLAYESVTPHQGVYTTLLGPLWVDFGYFAFVFLFFLGYLAAFSYSKVIKGNFLYLPLYGYFFAVIFFSPVVNLIQNALGVYILTSCFGLIFLHKLLKN